MIRIKYRKIFKTGALFFVSVFLLHIFINLYRGNILQVIFLDVGQGDSVLIKAPNGANFIIDTGSNYVTNQKLQKEVTFFNKKIDSILLTHPDKDHSGGTEDILKTNNVKNIILSTENKYEEAKYVDKTTVSYLNNQNKILISGLEMKILSPQKEMSGSVNGKSFVTALKYKNFNFIFMGDVDSETERSLISKGYFDDKDENKNIKNVLKVGHHGSDTSSSEIFLKKIKPEYCIISVGKDNTYGHPSKNALERLKKYCKNILRTDIDGNVYFQTDGKNISIDFKK